MILISHVMGFFPLTSLFRKYFRSTAAAGRDAKCDSLFSSCMLVSCVLTHEGLPVNVFFFFLQLKENLCFLDDLLTARLDSLGGYFTRRFETLHTLCR